MQSKEALGLTSGPAISDSRGFLLPSWDIDTMFHDLLNELFEMDSSLSPPTVTSTEEVIDNYQVNRTLRLTTNTRALEEKVGEEDINLVSKWEQRGVGKKKLTAQPMKHHYAQFDLLLQPFMRYTYQM